MSLSAEVIEGLKNQWLSELPSDWRFSRFGDVLQIKRRPIEVQDHVEYVQPVIRRGHGGIDIRERQLGASIKTKAQFLIRAGDWLMSKVQILHRSYGLVPCELDKALASGSYYAFEIQKELDPKYLWYLSHANAFHKSCELASVGVVIEKMVFRATDWLDFEFPLPPLHEQRQIAEILSSVDEAIAATRAVIVQSRKVKQAVLERLLTKGIGHTRFKQTEIGEIPEEWPLTSADSVCTQVSVGIVIKPSQYYVESGVRCFRSANVREGFVEDADWVYISDEGNRVNRKSVLRTGDVLVVRTGYPGTSCVVPPKYDGANCIDIIFARPKIELVAPYFLSTFINSASGKTQVLKAEGGLAQKHFNVGAMKQMKLPLPPLSEQHEIVAHIQEFANTEAVLEQTLQQQIGFKAALMSDLLTGRKRVTDALPMAAE
ncbi:restriction endonuclease subunit S [Rhizobium sp. BG4]|uniref:restriction endonuclease subunit S n=1 Tax=Rhizobium sp. BG4 TaxID=2613770 RepID=UPI00193E9330|nr:restriction endonuclease subunit S [Rhizobium sp. BG4]QRM47214.1 restriction endonuclease subunit S [Rhizobium sp. BG4]